MQRSIGTQMILRSTALRQSVIVLLAALLLAPYALSAMQSTQFDCCILSENVEESPENNNESSPEKDLQRDFDDFLHSTSPYSGTFSSTDLTFSDELHRFRSNTYVDILSPPPDFTKT